MSFRDRISKFINVNEGDYYDDTEYDEEDEDLEDEEMQEDEDIPVSKKSAFGGFRSAEKSRGNVVDFNQQSQQAQQSQHRSKPHVVLVKPATFDEANGIADHINEKKIVLLNIEATSRETARRLIDFLGGVVYANNGTMERVSNGTFALIPHGYDFSGDMNGTLEAGGIFLG